MNTSEFLHIFINVIFLGGAGIHLAYQLRTLILKEVTFKSIFVVFCSFGFLKQYFIFVSFFFCCWKLMRSNCRIESAYFVAFIRRGHIYPCMAKFPRKEGRTLWTAHTEVTGSVWSAVIWQKTLTNVKFTQ